MRRSRQLRASGGNRCGMDNRRRTVAYAEGGLKPMTDVFSSTWGNRSFKAHHFQYHMTSGYLDRSGTITLKMTGDDEHRPGSGIPSTNDTIIRAGHSLRKRFPQPHAGGIEANARLGAVRRKNHRPAPVAHQGRERRKGAGSHAEEIDHDRRGHPGNSHPGRL